MKRAADEGPPDDFVQSVGRALRVLEVVGAEPALPVKAIARRCGLNISTTYHLVRTMAYKGYLRRLPEGTYVIGDQVARRFHDLIGAFTRPPDAAAVLRLLTERTGLSAYLGCLHASRVTVVSVVEGPGSPYLEDFEAGLDVAPHATALGQVLLAALPRRERRACLAENGMRPYTANTCTDPAHLDATLSAFRPGEVLVEHGEFRDAVACAGTLVPRAEPTGPAWAVVVSARDEAIGDLPAQARQALLTAAGDLAGLRQVSSRRC